MKAYNKLSIRTREDIIMRSGHSSPKNLEDFKAVVDKTFYKITRQQLLSALEFAGLEYVIGSSMDRVAFNAIVTGLTFGAYGMYKVVKFFLHTPSSATIKNDPQEALIEILQQRGGNDQESYKHAVLSSLFKYEANNKNEAKEMVEYVRSKYGTNFELEVTRPNHP